MTGLRGAICGVMHWLARGLPVWAMLLAAGGACAAPDAIVGILQGSAVLVRQTQRFTLAEGAALEAGDIVETAKGGFAQLEFPDGTLAGVGEGTRLLLQVPPGRKDKDKGKALARLYLLEGWIKLRLPGSAPGAAPASAAAPAPANTPAGPGFSLSSPALELDGKEGAAVVRIQDKAWAVFVEAGAARVIGRGTTKATLNLKRGDFAALAAGQDKASISAQVAAPFLAELPGPFRDPLPPRAERFAKRTVTLKPLGPVNYEDVAAWLRSEPTLRQGLSRQWFSRASDPAFRTAAAANLKLHPEWERILFPERFQPPQAASEPTSESAAQPSRKK